MPKNLITVKFGAHPLRPKMYNGNKFYLQYTRPTLSLSLFLSLTKKNKSTLSKRTEKPFHLLLLVNFIDENLCLYFVLLTYTHKNVVAAQSFR